METPLHIGIILDGNRRYAKKKMLESWKGHELGARAVENLIDYVSDLGINQVTLYALSQENIKERSEVELDFLYKLFRKMFKRIEEKKSKNLKIRFIGDIEMLPKDLFKQCRKLEEDTKNNNGLIVNFCIAYGGKQEIIQAIKRIIKSKTPENKITEKIIEKYLHLRSKPDLVIRTGGDIRTSNFLPWQSTYSEWFFIKKLWPEFTKKDLIKIIKEFNNRKRNFGK